MMNENENESGCEVGVIGRVGGVGHAGGVVGRGGDRGGGRGGVDLLREGVAIPAQPLAVDGNRKLDERRQRALTRYYLAAGVGGIAVGVHTTQFQIHDPKVGLLEPVLRLAVEEMAHVPTCVRVAGVCGQTKQAVGEAELTRRLGYDAVLLSLAAMKGADDDALVSHARAVADVMPVIGFYLQASVGGRVLGYSFWRKFVEIKNVVAIKMAPFNRYQTIDVVRAVVESGRDDIALYTGNDDHIVLDLISPYRFVVNGQPVTRRIVGGLLGHWSVWTKRAVELLGQCHKQCGGTTSEATLVLAHEVADSNAAFFDSANGFAGCIAGLHEVLRRQGLLEGIWCLDPAQELSPGQMDEIDRVYTAYPHLNDDAFVAAGRDEWLS